MIKLRKEFKKKGVEFRNFFKDDKLVVYRLQTEDKTWYEVFRLVVHKKDMYHDDEYEKYPCDEHFGLWAWCCSDPSCVCKVINKEFSTHKLSTQLQKYVIGTYLQNYKKHPIFKISEEELLKEFEICTTS